MDEVVEGALIRNSLKFELHGGKLSTKEDEVSAKKLLILLAEILSPT